MTTTSKGTTNTKVVKVTKKSPQSTTPQSSEGVIKATRKRQELNLVEEVVSKREVKYKYPDDILDTLSRKKYRQEIRGKLKALELEMLRIKDKESTGYKKAEREYDKFFKQHMKA